jgi:hypothetical protein
MLRTCCRRIACARLFVVLLCLTSRVSAQDASASIAGTVVDPLGARVVGAAVTLLRDRGGGTTSVFIRGGNSSFNKMLIDGIPANDIGGGIDLSPFATTGVERIEVLRRANSVIVGPIWLEGVLVTDLWIGDASDPAYAAARLRRARACTFGRLPNRNSRDRWRG